MLTIAICDDNVQFAQYLSYKIRMLTALNLPDHISYRIAPIFNSGAEVLNYLQSAPIQILFLDIEMPQTSGFQLAEILRNKYSDMIIIFVSAFETYVFKAFEYSPFYFLRKSHLEKELPITLQKVIKKYYTNYESKIFITTDGEQSLRLKDIIYIESEKNYYTMYTDLRKNYRCRGTLTSAESLLGDDDFFRIHAAYIINYAYIDRLYNQGYVVMKNGKRINISRNRMATFKKAYMEYIRRQI
ncbi:MAG: LytR/AlgR family response regulator transcription factor [Eubacteriales bacterium]